MDKTEEIELQLLLNAVYQKYHYDFRDYAMASVRRRMKHAREYFKCRSYSLLQDKVLHDEAILPELLNFLTIQVSEMFRDPSYFRAIREKLVPHLRTYPSLKVWVAGCSAGEELYSLVILFREEGLEDRTIFYATDISADALQKAEAGIYSLDRMAQFSKNYQAAGGKGSLSDYFTTGYNGGIFDKSLRKHVVFSDHSLASDAVFAEMQLISCRNVLIYFTRELQDRAIGLFKDSLSHAGFLGLGSKESLHFSAHADAFSDFKTGERIYQRKAI
ncbi:MAG: chemotaxis protein CheR [Rickettsiales bacterium]|nr:chemotaxis protein CheR [Rickettsiales bacterium]|tara:strand:+ start:1446 stop:2267 length:822 start_codon:yes stop_codon:yes gene_type:complete